jgi:hypothetical protein
MGTSTSQRSPRTREWEQVHRLYDDPRAPPAAIVSRIVAALAPATREGMADSAVARCLGTLTSAGASALDEPWSIDPSLPAAVDLAAALRAAAERDIARARVASRFGELALDALSAAALDVAAGAADAPEAVRAVLARYGEQRRLPDLARVFVAQDTAYAFRYFAERDIPPHVGGPRLRTVADASRLVDDIAGLCRSATSSLEFGALEEQLGRAVAEGGAPGHPLYQAAAAQALHDSLRALGGLT